MMPAISGVRLVLKISHDQPCSLHFPSLVCVPVWFHESSRDSQGLQVLVLRICRSGIVRDPWLTVWASRSKGVEFPLCLLGRRPHRQRREQCLKQE